MATPRKLLVLDPDRSARNARSSALAERLGLEILSYGTAAAAFEQLRHHQVLAVVVAQYLPDMCGREFCRALRNGGGHMPVVVLGVGWTETEALLALRAGATDYLAREVSIELLTAKLLAHLQQYERSDRAALPVGELVFHPAQRLLVAPRRHRQAVLTPKEAAVLKVLYDAGNQVVLRATLLKEVWGYSSTATTHTVQTHIYRLRGRLAAELDERDLIITCGPGYRLRVPPGRRDGTQPPPS
jgi:DNA-binding response OmpR family regulator